MCSTPPVKMLTLDTSIPEEVWLTANALVALEYRIGRHQCEICANRLGLVASLQDNATPWSVPVLGAASGAGMCTEA